MRRTPAAEAEPITGPRPAGVEWLRGQPELSPREREVVRLLALQMSTTQIAAALSVSVNTVRTRVRRAVRKLGVEGRDEAAGRARDRGLV